MMSMYGSKEFNLEVFDHFVRWLCTGRLDIADREVASLFLFHIWLLVNRSPSRLMKNTVINAFAQMWREYKVSTARNITVVVLTS